MVPQELDDPVPEERRQVYKILRLLQVMVPPDEPPEVNGTFGGDSVLWISIVIPLTLDTYPHVLPGLGDAAAGAMDEALGWFGCSTLGPRYPWHLTSFTLRLSRSTCE